MAPNRAIIAAVLFAISSSMTGCILVPNGDHDRDSHHDDHHDHDHDHDEHHD